MEANLCPRTPGCALFNDNLLKRKESAEVYKELYCRAGESKYITCKRYMVSEKVKICPDNVMPNSSMTVNEIIEQMKNTGQL